MKSSAAKTIGPGIGLMLLLLLVVLGLLLGVGCLPGRTLFSNDGPLGRLISECHRLPSRFLGCWHDLNSIGYREGSAVPSVSYAIELCLGPLWFSKLYALLALLLLGVSAWCLFRQWRLAPAACLLGGLAASLNSAFFSTACWGMAAHAITVAMAFLALAALGDAASARRWLRVPLAGFAIGMAVMEGADVGAIFSLLLAVFVVYQACVIEGANLRNLGLGFARVAVVAVCAAIIAAASLGDLLVNNVENVVAAGAQETRSEGGHWDWATQWSLPKAEALGLVVPGLFGYRTDTPGGGNYWGATGRHAVWDRFFAGGRKGDQPQGLLRFVGGGNYAGVPVVLVAIWAGAQSFRRKDPIFDPSRRKLIWFWLAVSLFSLLLAFGRFAPFYRLVYALPYFSTIRNPVKFLHVFALGIVVLFALGVDGLWNGFLRPAVAAAVPRPSGFGKWWARAPWADKAWVQGCLAVLGLSLAGWAVYAMSRQTLEDYLQSVLFTPYVATSIAGFSITQVGWFLLFFGLAAGLMAFMLSGFFAGARARTAMVLLGLLLVIDLGRANVPWIKPLDYVEKYASNPIVDLLRERPYEHRVANLPRDFVSPGFQRTFRESEKVAASEAIIFRLYDFEWVQHLFDYYDIQSLNLVQLSRKPADLKAFEETFAPASPADFARVFPRYWQLTNTRYLVGENAFLPFLNTSLDPSQHRFRVVQRFNLKPKRGRPTPRDWADLGVVQDPNGDYALFEFTGALPRAALYSNWLVNTNEAETLRLLADPSHKPEQTVLVRGELPPSAVPGGGDPIVSAVGFASYASKHIVLKASSATPAILLLNDRFDPAWNVSVDGRPQPLLRCNYLMRGVFLDPGSHTVEFRFQPPHRALYVSLAGAAAAFALLGFVAWAGRGGEPSSLSASTKGRRSRTTRKSDGQEAVRTPANR